MHITYPQNIALLRVEEYMLFMSSPNDTPENGRGHVVFSLFPCWSLIQSNAFIFHSHTRLFMNWQLQRTHSAHDTIKRRLLNCC